MRVAPSEIEFTFVRSSGPGGQNVNKVNSKAVLRWNVVASPSLPEGVRSRFLHEYASKLTSSGDLILTSDAFRDQGRNREDCLKKLEAMIEEVRLPPKARKKTKISWSKKNKNKESKKLHSERKKSRSSRYSD
jgi:ribosome-associated protein